MGNKHRKHFYAGAWRSQQELAALAGISESTFRRFFYTYNWTIEKTMDHGTRNQTNTSAGKNTSAPKSATR